MYLEILGTNVRLLGSLHVVPRGEEQVPSWARGAYVWCEELVVEHEPVDFLPFFKGRESLQEKLSPELFSSLQEFWPLSGLLAPLDELRPWTALMAISALSQQVEDGIEPNFLRWAKEDQKPIECLELPKDVAKAFESVPIQYIQTAIGMALRDRPLMQNRLLEMHSAWLSDAPDRLLATASGTSLLTIPELRSVVLEDRNRSWIPKIEAFVGMKRKTLVVVGALHFCGPCNVLQLLGERGMQVAPIVR